MTLMIVARPLDPAVLSLLDRVKVPAVQDARATLARAEQYHQEAAASHQAALRRVAATTEAYRNGVRRAVLNREKVDTSRLLDEHQAAEAETVRTAIALEVAKDCETIALDWAGEAIRGSWRSSLPFVARERRAGRITDELNRLYLAFTWPVLKAAPGERHSLPLPPSSTPFPLDYTGNLKDVSWWPPPLDNARGFQRPDHDDWIEWIWEQLAEKAYVENDDGTISVVNEWTPPDLHTWQDVQRERGVPRITIRN